MESSPGRPRNRIPHPPADTSDSIISQRIQCSHLEPSNLTDQSPPKITDNNGSIVSHHSCSSSFTSSSSPLRSPQLKGRTAYCSLHSAARVAPIVLAILLLTLTHQCLANTQKRDLFPSSASHNNGRSPHFSTKRSGTSLCGRIGGIGPLGMESGAIADNALTASSSHNKLHVGPQNARLNRDIAGGAWCPHSQIGPDSENSEWIQIDLGPHRHVITGIATQGRYGNGYGAEYSESYELAYSRQDTPTKWTKWIGYSNHTILNGNSDPNTVFENDLEGPMTGVRYVRLLPVSNNTRMVCFRIELYGCLHNGPLSYTSVPQPTAVDRSYDGGLGKLTDGVFAIESSESFDSLKTGNADPVWVEWSAGRRVEIRYNFDQIQNFTSLNINTLANKTGVASLKKAVISFSLDSINWNKSPVLYSLESTSGSGPNVKNFVKDINIDLRSRIGRHVRLELFYTSEKLLISETQFDSIPLDVNWTGEQLQELFERSHVHRSVSAYQDNAHQAQQEHQQDGSHFAYGSHRPSASSSRPFTPTLILGGVAVFAILGAVSLGAALAYRRHVQQRRTGRHAYGGSKMSTSLTGFLSATGSDLSAGGVIPGATGNGRFDKSLSESLSVVSQHLYCDPKDIEAEYAVPDAMGGASRFYASSDLVVKPNLYTIRPSQTPAILNPQDLTPNAFRTMQAQLPVQQQIRKLTSKSGTLFPLPTSTRLAPQLPVSTQAPANFSTCLPLELRGIRAFQETEIGVLESMGKSRFGDVLLCKIGQARRPTIVRTTMESLKPEFLQTVQLWNSISAGSPDKFAQILGVIETPTYFATVQEHSECDLHQFLNGVELDSLSYETLLQMGAQIASGGVHLESIAQPHRDLAARNIIVVSARRIRLKLTDAGAFQSSRYGADYFNGSLPVRWSAPETIVASHFSLPGDVHSFGVLLWEILTYCRRRPFEALSDQQLIDRAYSLVELASAGISTLPSNFLQLPVQKLEQPEVCTTDLYDLMLDCMNPKPAQRPTFHELFLFLQRKTLNYSSSSSGGPANLNSSSSSSGMLSQSQLIPSVGQTGSGFYKDYATISSPESHEEDYDEEEDGEHEDSNPYSNL